MHILVIPSEHFMTKEQPLGGIFQYHQAKALAKFGYKVGILSVGYITPRYLFKQYKYEKSEKLDGLNIKRNYKQLYFPHRFLSFKFLKKSYINLAENLYLEYIKEFGQPEIIHAHNFLYGGLIAYDLFTKYKVPYMITEHSSSFSRYKLSDEIRECIHESAYHAFEVTSVSSSFRILLEEYTKSHINILPNIVDEYFFEKRFLKQNKEEFIFLNIASLDENKNQTLLIETFAKVAKKKKNVSLRIAGSGIMEIQLKKLVQKLKIEKKVVFLGRIEQEKVRDEMMHADSFVLTSNYETFGVVLIEALACGTPLIATKCGGPEDIVNISNGKLITTGSKSELESAMYAMYDHYEEYDSAKLRNDTKERFGEDAFVRIISLYYNEGKK